MKRRVISNIHRTVLLRNIVQHDTDAYLYDITTKFHASLNEMAVFTYGDDAYLMEDEEFHRRIVELTRWKLEIEQIVANALYVL